MDIRDINSRSEGRENARIEPSFGVTHEADIPVGIPDFWNGEAFVSGRVEHQLSSEATFGNTASTENETDAYDVTLKGLAGFGLIVLLSVAAWGGVQFVKYAPAMAASANAAFSDLKERISFSGKHLEVTTESDSYRSGVPFAISWASDNETGGSYALYYPCVDDFYLTVPAADGGQEIVFCNTVHQFENATDSITVTPFGASGKEMTEVSLTVQFRENGATKVSSEGTVTIEVTKVDVDVELDDTVRDTTAEVPVTPASRPIVVPAPQQSSEATPAAPVAVGTTSSGLSAGTPTEDLSSFGQTEGVAPLPASDPNGTADLKAAIVATGIVDRTTNIFEERESVTVFERAAVKFTVENLGTKESGAWYFSAVLPTSPFHIYTSKSQPSLKPGERIEYVLGFDSIKGDASNEVIVNVDPSGAVREVTEENNIVKATIKLQSS